MWHGAEIVIKVDESVYMDSFKEPQVAQYTKAFVGISTLLTFGTLSLRAGLSRHLIDRKNGAPGTCWMHYFHPEWAEHSGLVSWGRHNTFRRARFLRSPYHHGAGSNVK
ncbi:MAG: hypothetical protein C0399_05430 [Syntrophus sp. (in: bacteria)]|nr:hypothetical protein [Syntrophus sp. (in: bacteria)]